MVSTAVAPVLFGPVTTEEKKMKTLTILIRIFSLVSLVGCGSFKVRDRDDQAVAGIKKAALISFSVYEPQSPKVGFNLSKGQTEARAGGTMGSQSDPTVDQMYGDLQASLSKGLNWKVLGQNEMTVSEEYKRAYKRTMEGWQNKMPPGEGIQHFKIQNVMDFDSARILGPQGRDQLIDGLGVDALVVARVDVLLNGTSIMGFGSKHPQARLALFVYKKGIEKPVWFDGGIDGSEAKESVGSTAFIDDDLLKKLSTESARTAFNQIGSSPK